MSLLSGGVEIGDQCQILTHSIIKRNTRTGLRNIIHEHTILGGDPRTCLLTVVKLH